MSWGTSKNSEEKWLFLCSFFSSFSSCLISSYTSFLILRRTDLGLGWVEILETKKHGTSHSSFTCVPFPPLVESNQVCVFFVCGVWILFMVTVKGQGFCNKTCSSMTMTRVLIWGGLLYYSFADFVQNSCYIVFNYDTFHRDNSLVWFKPAICRARHSRLGVDCSDILHLVCWSSHGRNLLIFSGLYHFLASFFFFFFVFFIFALILLVELK